MGKTSISWCDYSWPIINGCQRISEGCRNCYAERLTATRLRHLPKYEGLAEMSASGPRWTGRTRFWRPDLSMPFHIKRPSRIFVADMGDLFFEGVSMTDLTDIFEVMARCPQHIFLVLTKRPERMATLWHDLGTGVAYRCEQEKQKKFWPLPNVQIGTSVEDQKSYDERVPWLLRIPALVRFVSAEPLLEDIDIHLDDCLLEEDHYETYERLQWVIIGGESGPLARPCNVEWIRSLRDQCVAAGIAMHIKQLGRVPVIASARGQGPEDLWPLGTSFGNSTHDVSLNGRVALLRDHKGSDPSEWPEDLRVRQWPA